MDIKGLRSGQSVCVRSLQPMRGWQDRELITIPAGAEYHGIVQNLNSYGFFDLEQDTGDVQYFSAYDTSISVTRIDI